jgi:hypothetical protein
VIGKNGLRGSLALLAIVGAALVAPLGAQAEHGIESFDVQLAAKAPAPGDEAELAPSGGAYHDAGGHPYSVVTHIVWSNHPDVNGLPLPNGDIKDTYVDLPAGLAGNPSPFPRCTALQLTGNIIELSVLGLVTECPNDSQVGTIHLFYTEDSTVDSVLPLFNMTAPTGSAGRFGFNAAGTLIYFDASTSAESGYRITVGTHDAQQALRVFRADVTFWGVPADPSHDGERCNVGALVMKGTASHASCPKGAGDPQGPHSAGVPRVPFLTLPTSCPPEGEGEEWPIRTDSWQEPNVFAETSVHSHLAPFAPDPSAPGQEQGTTGCGRVPFNPDFSASPTQHSGASSTGLNLHLTFPQDGLLNPEGIAQSHLKQAVVTLPEGMTINPSQAEGLGVCSPDQFKAASVTSFGCPSTAKIGTVEVKSPLLEEKIPGNVYIAEPYNNPSKSLIALYIVLREPQRGIAIGLPGKVEPDPSTGQIIATFDDLPQLPFESFDFKFREGPRAPLITPSRCGRYTTGADFYPWARPGEAVHNTSSFEVTSGPGGGPCPQAGVPPFHPGFSAGSLNNNAGSFSPFLMKLTRQDGEQDMTKFSAVLPPGVSAKIAGVSKCPDGTIELTKQKTGTEEREAPSCPASSKIGDLIAGAGVGSSLVHVPGSLYLAGPYNGTPLSAVAVVPAVAGPFDVGTVVTRVALSLDPRTAEVRVDGDRSDPIPHILKGIPLSVRDIDVNVDRPGFTINPTGCNPSRVGATLFGSNLDLFSAADDIPVALSNRFQAASCASLGFKPALSLKLSGGTKRGQFPGLRAELKPRKGDANSKNTVVTLPHSAFLEQSHIRTICTRVQYAAKTCPAGSIYGHVKAFTPLLDEPLEGPVYLRSSNHKLPDMVLSLHGLVDVEAVGRIDSKNGGIRASFEAIPDAPLSKVLLTMQGQKKGLIVNSTNLCKGKGKKADAQFDGQNGVAHDFKPALKSACKKQGNAKRRNHKKHRN